MGIEPKVSYIEYHFHNKHEILNRSVETAQVLLQHFFIYRICFLYLNSFQIPVLSISQTLALTLAVKFN